MELGYIHNPFIKSAFDDNTESVLFEILSNHKLISDKSRIIPWQWIGKRNQLSHLAKYLKVKRILGDDCHKELSVYIADPKPNTKKSLKNITDISDKSKTFIESITDEFIAKISK